MKRFCFRFHDYKERIFVVYLTRQEDLVKRLLVLDTDINLLNKPSIKGETIRIRAET